MEYLWELETEDGPEEGSSHGMIFDTKERGMGYVSGNLWNYYMSLKECNDDRVVYRRKEDDYRVQIVRKCVN